MSSATIPMQTLSECQKIARQLSDILILELPNKGILLGLSGELGGGKTTFVGFLTKLLGAVTPVSSPTYVLSHEYQASQNIVIEHWDLYRRGAENSEELFEPLRPGILRIVEWIERNPELLQSADIKLHFTVNLDESRSVLLEWNQNRSFAKDLAASFCTANS